MITIVDYGMGNLESIKNMIRKIGGKASITSNLDEISEATALILPGVGHFGKAIDLIKTKGLEPMLTEKVKIQKTPVLGICLGMQLMMEHSEEGNSLGLGWIAGNVRKFTFSDDKMKVPHMGWSEIMSNGNSPLLKGLEENARFYFVHSYFVQCAHPENILAKANYGFDFTCSIINENIYGTQFHPEKSHKFGMHLLKNYLQICGE
jgi:imidazole glycerol-phosphate synthase subunit HisH